MTKCAAKRLARVALPWLFWLVAALASRGALAREPTAQDRATARQLAAEGYEALQSGDYTLAADRFKRADALVHAPTLLLDLGRSYVGLGRLVEAHEAFQQVLREGVAPDAPVPWHQALANAKKEDAAVAPRLAWVTIRVEGSDKPRVQLDDEELLQASLGVKRAVDPGRRTAVAEAAGFLPARDTIDLGEGEVGEIHLVLKRDPDYHPPRKAIQRRPVVSETPPPRPRTLSYVAYGVSGAGLLLGGVSTVLMLRTRSDLEAQCFGGKCPESAAGDLSRYHTYGTLAAVGLGVGLAGAGVGTYFLLSRKPKDETEQQYTMTAQISPGYVGVSGRF